MDSYLTHTLPNGLRLVHLPHASAVSYCGVIINVGSRDEKDDEFGMAHFIEHMLFKGTSKRKSRQIINRLEDVGGELNAYTTKEETVVYAAFLKEYTERSIELVADIVQHSVFPQQEIEKEAVIIQDEIKSYYDSPSELIFDDFEEILFKNNSMAHNVLGTKKHLKKYNTSNLTDFYTRFYSPQEMVFFSLGSVDFTKIVRYCERYFDLPGIPIENSNRIKPAVCSVDKLEIKRKTHQVHCLLGTNAYDIYHPDRMILYLLNNILGGPGMNSLLNLSLRERNGLVYSVESNYQPFTDSGWWTIYFGTDAENAEKCEKLVRLELSRLCDSKISAQKLHKYKFQLMGQMAIATENMENLALSLGKSYMRYGKFEEMEEIRRIIHSISSDQLQRVAIDVFNPEKLTVLKYV